MEHSFDIDLAAEIGIKEAVIFKNIAYWVLKNEANKKHFYDGNTWTYNSVKAFSEIFYYMSPKEIRNALSRLERSGLIVSGNYNSMKTDRTKWYALTDAGKSICQRGKYHLPESENGVDQKGKAIPNINTYGNPNINNNNVLSDSLEEFFNRVWTFYPVKKGKGAVSRTAKQKLMKVGEDQLKRCVERYLAERDELKASGRFCPELVNGSTFFNSRYIDYLDENYIQKEAPKELPEEEPVMDLWVGD